MRDTRSTPCVNRSLITLKIVVFFVITGITALHILHAIKPQLLGFNFEEYRNITIIAPFVSILGPLIAGPLADRFAAKNSNNFGRVLRFLTALFLLIAAIIYACLFAIPEVERHEEYRPLVSFGCNQNGAIIFQERCSKTAQCTNWDSKSGILNLTRCTYTCQDPTQYEALYKPWLEYYPTPSPSTEHSSEFDYGDDEITSAVTESMRLKSNVAEEAVAAVADSVVQLSAENGGGELLSAEEQLSGSDQARAARVQRQTNDVKGSKIADGAAAGSGVAAGGAAAGSAPAAGGGGGSGKVYVHPPHLCITKKNATGHPIVQYCHAYTADTTSILLNSVMQSARSKMENENETSWCEYPIEDIQCTIPQQQADYMIDLKKNTKCKPIIECQVHNPYDAEKSLLVGSQCIKTIGNLDKTLTGYTIIRLLGDIFTLAALALLNTAIVIAVRETSEGRGEVCRQYVWGAIGFVLLFSLLDLNFMDEYTQNNELITNREHTSALVALILVIVCFIIGALVLLVSSNMPLSPAEWWWHTKTGVMVYPMSAIRIYCPEIFLLTLVSILFGTFWSSIHSFLKWTFTDQYAVTQAGLLLVLLLFFNVDRFIEYCGHSNIFIAGFAIFIIRFTALTGEETKWLTIVMEVIEPLVIGVIWITIMLYMRHAMPRKLTGTGQALAVLAFFGIGKGCGALIGLARNEWTHNQHRREELPFLETRELHEWLAIAACIIALVYFIIYNLILAPRCAAKPQHFDDLISGSASQTLAGGANGSGGAAGGAAAGSANNGAGAALNGNGNYSPLRVYHNERGKKGQFRF